MGLSKFVRVGRKSILAPSQSEQYLIRGRDESPPTSIYIDVRRGRKTERLPLEAKIEAETIEQEDETKSETVE